jgi:nucleoside-diphosphate-sugar epimerase
MTVRQLAEVINRLTGNAAGIRQVPEGADATDPQRRQPDTSRARRLLQWEAATSLEEGLTTTIAFFRGGA